MHPIERLRYVARSSGAPQALLVRETAGALSGLGFDPAGLVTACRRIVDRHVTSAPLWWLCARVLTATDPLAEAYRAADEIEADPTPSALADALPSDATVCVLGWPDIVGDVLVRRGDLDVLVVDALGEGSGLARRLRRADVDAEEVPTAIGGSGAIAVSGSRAAAAVARHAGVPVWMVGGVGRVLPGRMWEALLSRLDEASEPWDSDDECVPLDLVDALFGPVGPEPVADGVKRVDCPVTPELFRPTAF